MLSSGAAGHINLAVGLTLGMSPLALFTALAVGYFALRNVEQASLPATFRSITLQAEQSAKQITRAVDAFDQGVTEPLPTEVGGEIGVLARAFERHGEREQLLSAVFAHSSHAIMTTTNEGIITGWNPAAARLYGYTADEAIGQELSMLVPDDGHEQFEALVQVRHRGETIEPTEVERVTKDGRRVTVLLAMSPILSQAGELAGASVIARDVTEQKRAEDRFRTAFDASPAGMFVVDYDRLGPQATDARGTTH